MNEVAIASQGEVAVTAAVANPFGTAVVPRQSSALAGVAEQRAIAEVQAKMLMAEKFPRNELQCSDRIINSFARPGLAEQAKYQYARGGTNIDGPSIRAAEAMAAAWQNMEFGFRELSRHTDREGVSFSQVEAYAFDMQNRTRRAIEFNVRHWRDTRQGGYALKDERDIYELMANYAQRRVRACILALIPGDVVDAAMAQAESTLRANADTSPEGMGKLVEAFQPFGVTKAHLEKKIQRRLDSISPAQVVLLRKIYLSLRDQVAQPHEHFEIEAAPPAAVDALNDQIKQQKPAKARGQPPATTPPPPPAPAAPAAEDLAQANEDIPLLSFAQVADALNKSTDRETLDIAGDLIGGVADAGQRKELSALYRQLLAEKFEPQN